MRCIAVVLLLFALPAAAQTPLVTRLALTETASREVADDRYLAVVEGRIEAASAAEAQAALNRAMLAALDAVRGVDGLTAATQGYYVQEREHEGLPTTWVATQSLRLETADRDLLLARVGALQALGLATRQLGSQLSPAGHAALRDELLAQALTAIRRQAETVAAQLGLRVVGYAEIGLDGFRPMPMARAVAMEAQAAAPVLTEGTSTAQVSVSATVLLTP